MELDYIVISKAAQIQGWMPDPELVWLSTLALKSSTGVEVGCWKGRSTLAIGHHIQGTLYAVDHWRGNRENLNDVHKEAVDLGPDGLYKIFYNNVKSLVDSGKVIPVRKSSVEAAKYLIKEKGEGWADFVFLDAGHSNEEVTNDIIDYTPMLKEYGTLCGHDAPYVEPTLNRLFGRQWRRGVGDIWVADKGLNK